MTANVIANDVPAVDAQRVLAGAWPRLWARLIDMWVLGTVMGLLIAFLLPEQVASIENDALLGLMILPFALALEAFVYAGLGTTLGKAVVGIDLATIRGDRAPFSTLVRRQAYVWIYGLALGIPLFAIFTYIGNAKKLAAHKLTQWDEELFTRVTGAPSPVRVTIAAIMWLAFAFGVTAWGAIAEEQARPLDEYSSTDTIAEKLEAFAAAGRTQTPQTLDDETRMDTITADGRQLTYHYTLTSLDNSPLSFDAASSELRSILDKGTARSWYCDDPDKLGLRNASVAVRHAYASRTGKPLGEVVYKPGDCATTR